MTMWNDRVFVLCKKQNEIKKVCDLDDFNKDALRWIMFKMYYNGIYPTTENRLRRWNRVLILKEVLILCIGYKEHRQILTNLIFVAIFLLLYLLSKYIF